MHIKPHRGKDMGDCQRMMDIGLPGLPRLSLIGLFSKLKGLPD